MFPVAAAYDGEEIGVGKLGKEYTTEQGQIWARNCMLNVLAVLKRDLGSLDRIKSFDKITVFVASADEFYEQPQVANGATALLQEVFGDEVGLPTPFRHRRQCAAGQYPC